MKPTREQFMTTHFRNMTTEELIRAADTTPRKTPLENELLERLVTQHQYKITKR